MTQRELDRAVALATGEDLSEIRRRGFSIAAPCADFGPEPLPLPPQTVNWDEADRERRVSFFAPDRRSRQAA